MRDRQSGVANMKCDEVMSSTLYIIKGNECNMCV